MSTKIYNGIAFNVSDFFDLHEKINALRVEAYDLAHLSVGKLYIELAVWAYDMRSMGDAYAIVEHNNFLKFSRDLINSSQESIKKTKCRDPKFDFEFSLSVFPVVINGEKKFFGIYYCEKEELSNLLLKKEWVSDYHYQNQTDMPDGMTEEEWDLRKEVWDKVFSNYRDVPSQVGYNRELVPLDADFYRILYSPLDIDKYLPKIEDRIAKIKNLKIMVEREGDGLEEKCNLLLKKEITKEDLNGKGMI